MKKLLLIFMLVLSAQVMFAQLYSTAEQQRYKKKVAYTSASFPQPHIAVASSTTPSVRSTFVAQPSRPMLTVHAWKGEVSAVGTALNSSAPAVRRSSGFPGTDPGDPGDTPPAPLGDTPWLVLLLCAGGYILTKRQKQSI